MNRKRHLKRKLGYVVQIRVCPFDVNVMLNLPNANTLHADVYSFENREENLHFQKYLDCVDRTLDSYFSRSITQCWFWKINVCITDLCESFMYNVTLVPIKIHNKFIIMLYMCWKL